MPIVTETKYEFLERHEVTSDLQLLRISDGFLLPNGAMMRATWGGQWLLIDPPGDRREQVLLSKRYREERMRRIERDFKLLKHAYKGGPPWTWPEHIYGPAPGRDPVAALRRLKKLHGIEADALAAIEAELEELPQSSEERRKELRKQTRDEEYERLEAERQAVEEIEL